LAFDRRPALSRRAAPCHAPSVTIRSRGVPIWAIVLAAPVVLVVLYTLFNVG
jgi:type VI protein secretion system component VasF